MNKSSVYGIYASPLVFTWSPLEAPRNLRVVYDTNSNTLSASWDAVSGAASYTVQVLNNGTQAWSPGGPVTTTSISEPNLSLAIDTQYTFSVVATQTSPQANTSAASIVGFNTTALGSPSNVDVAFAGTSIIVTCDAVDGADGYIAQLIAMDGATVSPVLTGFSATPSITLDGSGLGASTEYELEVAAVVTDLGPG